MISHTCMLYEFLTANLDEIIARARATVAKRIAPRPTDEELKNGVPLFLRQLIETLRLSLSSRDEMAKSATLHGGELLRRGYTIAQVVHDYGDICQVVTSLAIELNAPITAQEFNILNGCLDDAIAEAVTEYARQRDQTIATQETERVGALAHELRNLLNTSQLAFEMLKMGNVGVNGSTSAVLDRGLTRLRHLVNRSLTEVRLEAQTHRKEPIAMDAFIEDVEVDACIEARSRQIQLTVAPVDHAVVIAGDRQLLASAVVNILQNAFKFTRPHSHVALTVRATESRVLIEVEDECGGLAGGAEGLFRPFEQRSADRSGLGLGLSITRQAVAANCGEVRVRDMPGHGCVFTIDLPRVPALPPETRSPTAT
jgi:signal transduction histidine kinase